MKSHRMPDRLQRSFAQFHRVALLFLLFADVKFRFFVNMYSSFNIKSTNHFINIKYLFFAKKAYDFIKKSKIINSIPLHHVLFIILDFGEKKITAFVQ